MSADDEAQSAAARVLKLLQCIAAGEREFSLKDVAERSGLPPSTVHRLLGFLVNSDMVERAGPKAYRLGPEIFRVASLILQKFELHKIAQPFLQELWTEWQETCSFCLYKPATRTATIVASIRTPHPLQFVFEPHAEISLGWGSMGRSILAHLPKDDVDAILAQDRPGPISGRRLPSRKTLRDELAQIRERGCAVYRDETVDLAGVAAPVFSPGGPVIGSLGVTMPASRFRNPDKDELCAAVTSRAQRLSSALGYAEEPTKSAAAVSRA